MGKKRKHNNHNNVLHIFSNDTYVEFEFTPLLVQKSVTCFSFNQLHFYRLHFYKYHIHLIKHLFIAIVLQ